MILFMIINIIYLYSFGYKYFILLMIKKNDIII